VVSVAWLYSEDIGLLAGDELNGFAFGRYRWIIEMSHFPLDKLRWLFRTSTYHQHPFRTIYRVLRWEMIRYGNKPIQFQFDHSLVLKLYPNDGAARLTYYFNYHEPEIFRFLDKYLQPNSVFVDVGANIGCYTLFASKRVGEKGKVLAFEPQPLTYRRLVENIQSNRSSNVIAEPYAVGRESGPLQVVSMADTARTYTQEVIVENPSRAIQGIEICQAVSLDDYFRDHPIYRIDYIKIDVEGFEFEVLLGAMRTLTVSVPLLIQIELFDELQVRSTGEAMPVQEFLTNLGYGFYSINKLTNQLQRIPSAQKAQGNVFLIHESNMAKLRKWISSE
jgi:FkbM family methyltransferase